MLASLDRNIMTSPARVIRRLFAILSWSATASKSYHSFRTIVGLKQPPNADRVIGGNN